MFNTVFTEHAVLYLRKLFINQRQCVSCLMISLLPITQSVYANCSQNSSVDKRHKHACTL